MAQPMVEAQSLGQSIADTAGWLFTVVLTVFIFYGVLSKSWVFLMQRLPKSPGRKALPTDSERGWIIIISILIAIYLSFTWWLEPMKVIYDPSAPPF